MFQWKVDNWKPQAGGHVTGLCRRSISGRNDLLFSFPRFLSLRFFYFFARCFPRCALTNWTPGRGYTWNEFCFIIWKWMAGGYTITYSSLRLLNTLTYIRNHCPMSPTKPSRDKRFWTFSVVTPSIYIKRVSGKHYSTTKMCSIFIEWEHKG